MIYLSAGMVLRLMADQTRNRNRRRKSMSGTPAWASGSRKPESLNDNDTFAYRKHGNQGSVWGMLQQDRALQGVRRSARPVLHIPFHTGQSE